MSIKTSMKGIAKALSDIKQLLRILGTGIYRVISVIIT
ncbi:hypothetical protein NNO_1256 [Hydrogenimonas sp.]|nr:hypothetical protein NNO_1256 [Hydrogenimonas sp.]